MVLTLSDKAITKPLFRLRRQPEDPAMNDRELEAGLRAFYRAQVSETETAPLSLRRDVAAIPRTATGPRRLFGGGRDG